MAAHATVNGDRLTLRAMIADADGRRLVCDEIGGPASEAAALGAALAERLLAAGGAEIVTAARR